MAVAMAGVAAFVWWRRKQALALEWPSDIGLQKLVKLVGTYLRHQGWTTFIPEAHHEIMIASKGKQTLRLICLPSLVLYNGAKLKDLSETALMPGSRPLIGLTTVEVPEHLRRLAASGEVLLLHYKSLRLFAADQTNTAETLQAMRAALLKPSPPPSRSSPPPPR